MTDDRLARRVAAVLCEQLPDWEPGELGRLADRTVDALFPDGAVLTEQCGIQWSDEVGDESPYTRVTACHVANEIMAVGGGTHVHRVILETPWQPFRPPWAPVGAPEPVRAAATISEGRRGHEA